MKDGRQQLLPDTFSLIVRINANEEKVPVGLVWMERSRRCKPAVEFGGAVGKEKPNDEVI
ncbi:MAG TPA: hypothetical protein VKQ28_02270 [Candidatus Acidoferrum sp.]|nr:hypothetical protein [Candidatus Acidoferrum sp.]